MCGVVQKDINYITKTFTSAKVTYCTLHIKCFRNFIKDSNGAFTNNNHMKPTGYVMTVCCPSWDGTRTTDSQLKGTIHSNCCIYTVYLLMMGYKYARNMYGLSDKIN